MDTTERDFLSVGEVAARLKVAPSTIRYWESRGEIPHARRVGIAEVRLWGPDDVAQIERRADQLRATRARAA